MPSWEMKMASQEMKTPQGGKTLSGEMKMASHLNIYIAHMIHLLLNIRQCIWFLI